jgi:hypothetical protein
LISQLSRSSRYNDAEQERVSRVPGDWSVVEVEAVVADHLEMLKKELARVPYNKSVHRRALSAILNLRSGGSIERKHQNISAVLIELGYPYISGYKPLGNYQGLLGEVVASRAAADEELAALVEKSVLQQAAVPTVADILAHLEDAPPSGGLVYPSTKKTKELPGPRRVRVNYLELEARNASLGHAGEEFALNFERARLLFAGRDSLASKVENIAQTEGDGAGFDIRSYETDGSDRMIEVKTTAYGK